MISRLSQLIEDATRESPFVIIEGMTGTGKSELLHHIYTEHKKREGSLYYFSVQEDQWASKWRKPAQFVKEVFEAGVHHAHIFIDDVHLIPSPLRFLQQIISEFETRGCNTHITVTTGTALHQPRSVATDTPQPVSFRVYGASLRDILNPELPDTHVTYDTLLSIQDTSDVRTLYDMLMRTETTRAVQEFVRYGGLRVESGTHTLQKSKRIEELCVVRDKHFQTVIGPMCSIQRSFKCFAIAEYISQYTGRLLKEKDVETAVQYPVHRIKKGLQILNDSFLFQFSTPFFSDTRYETAKRPIVYATDPGIVVSFVPSDASHLVDTEQEVLTFLYSEFLKQYRYDDIQYYRTIVGKQIPFILQKQEQLVAVGLSLGSDHSSQLSVLKSFQRKYADRTTRTVLLTKNTCDLDLDAEIPLIPYVLAPFIAFL